MAVLTLSENDDNIKSLTKTRPLASIPIGGRYRMIDFILSNLVNFKVHNVGVFTQSHSRSLIDHIGSGKPWDLDRKLQGMFIFNFESFNSRISDVEMIGNNLEYLYRSKEEYVILATSHIICNLDFDAVAKAHEKSSKDITIVYKKIDKNCRDYLNCNIVNLNDKNKVIGVGKNIDLNSDINFAMDIIVMKRSLLIEIINKCMTSGNYTCLRQWIYSNVSNYDVGGYEFKGYLANVNSINTYYNLNMDMLDLKINEELFYKHGPIYTKIKDEAPSLYGKESNVKNSLVANGCILEGEVLNSVLGRRVKIGKGSSIKDCIIMQNCVIGENVHLENVIMDKNTVIEENKVLKCDREHPLLIEKTPLKI